MPQSRSGSSPQGLPERIPRHVAIIMDGNGRWARARGLPRTAGHRAGAENLRRVLEAVAEFGIEILTIYAFSTENWKRPEQEIHDLFGLIDRMIDSELDKLVEQGIRVRHIGRKEGLPRQLVAKIHKAEELTRANSSLILNVALNYGGRAELVDAIRKIVSLGIPAESISEDLVSTYLGTAGLPDPDLIIRTAGEMRLSNFLIWQAAYAEFYSTPTYWPDFDREELLKALQDYARRERRFGGLVQA